MQDPASVSAVYTALGLPEPAPDDRPRADEAALIEEFVRIWSLVDETGGAQVRMARMIGDGTRSGAGGSIAAALVLRMWGVRTS